MTLEFSAWGIEAETGYKPITTFWMDFSIREAFGEKAIKETFTQAFKEWKDNVPYFTEMVMVLNWKVWQYADWDKDLAGLYYDLWRLADAYAMKQYKGEDLKYFLRTTD